MNENEIIAECIERKKLTPNASPEQILNSVMDEIAAYRNAMKARPEFRGPPEGPSPDSES